MYTNGEHHRTHQRQAAHSSLFSDALRQFHVFLDDRLRPEAHEFIENCKRVAKAELNVAKEGGARLSPLFQSGLLAAATTFLLGIFSVSFFGALIGAALGAGTFDNAGLWTIGVCVAVLVANVGCVYWCISVFKRLSVTAANVFGRALK